MKVLFLTCLLIVVATAQLPSFMKRCKRDANFNECCKSNLNGAKGLLKEGIPSLFVPKCDPLVMDRELFIETPKLNITTGKGFIYDGMDTFTVRDVNLDLDKNTLYVNWVWDKLTGHGDYKFEGKLLNFEVDGGNNCHVVVENMGILLTMSGEREERGGKSYLIFKNSDVKLDLSNLNSSIHFNDLLPSAEDTENANKELNENHKKAIGQFRPVIAATTVNVVTTSLKNIFENYSVDELFIM